jgi:hypothetical protein
MRSTEFITESAKLWSAKVRISQANYVGYVDAQVWAPNANVARTILKQQYNIQDHHVGSVKEIKMKAKEFVKEATGSDWQPVASQVGSNVGDVLPEVPADFNPNVALRKITLLTNELRRMQGLKYEERAKIVAEIRRLENMISLYQAAQPIKPNKEIVSDDGAPYMIYTDVVQAGQFGAHTLQGAKNVGKRAVIQQKANKYIIVTDNKNKIVFVWYPQDHENRYKVGGIYRPPSVSGEIGSRDDQPRYPEGHPYAGAVMPPNIPIVTDWQAQEPRPTASQPAPERYMGQAQRVNQGGLPQPTRKRK